MYLFYMFYTQKNDLCPSQIYDKPSCEQTIFMGSFEVIPNNKSHVGIPKKWTPKLKTSHYIKHHYQILINMTYHYRL